MTTGIYAAKIVASRAWLAWEIVFLIGSLAVFLYTVLR